MLLSVLAATVIALALVAQATGFGSGFTAFALVLLPVVLFLGLTTYIRLVAVNHDETRWVLGMNRNRTPIWNWRQSWSGGSSPATTTTKGRHGHRRLGDLPDPVRLCHHPGRGGRHRRRGRRRDRRAGNSCARPASPLAAALGVVVAVAVAVDLALTAYSR
jgi:hypothetical protein